MSARPIVTLNGAAYFDHIRRAQKSIARKLCKTPGCGQPADPFYPECRACTLRWLSRLFGVAA